MTVIYEKDNCKLIKHDRQLHCFQSDDGGMSSFQLKQILFDNFSNSKRKKNLIIKEPEADNEITTTKRRVENFLAECKMKNLFPHVKDDASIDRLKAESIELMNRFQAISREEPGRGFHGENSLSLGKRVTMNDKSYLIPPNSRFFNKRIEELETCLPANEANNMFDLIIIDPPWKNRYIKRLKKNVGAKKQQGYFMMTDDEIIQIPLEKYSKTTSLVVIWCTNSETHLSAVKDKFLAKWKLKLLSSWLWIKIDKNGELFNSFDGNKKPFEQLFIATHQDNEEYDRQLENDCFVFSEPSSIHSHKPPLLDIFRHQLPKQPMCLEIFARSLYKNFTSIGLEVLKLQNEMLYENVTRIE